MEYTKDDELLMNLGYKPELRRNFSPIQVFGIAFSIMSLMPSIASIFGVPLMAGGVGITWGWLAPAIFILTVGLSLAELGSAMPTSGGLYWWTFKFAPNNYRRVLCWLAGYANCFGLIGGFCSINYGFATMIMSVPNIATDGRWESTQYERYGVFVACTIAQAFVSTISSRVMPRIQTFCILMNAILIVVVCVALPVGLVRSGGKINSGKFVFGDTSNFFEGWPYGWSFFLAWMACIWTIGAFDSCIHMSEEASNAATAVPLGIIMAISLCGILGFAIMCVLAAVVSPDIQSVLDSATGSPFAQVVLDCLGKRWAIGIELSMAVIQWMMGLSVLVATSRQTWSFSRDGALPLSTWVSKINSKGVPIMAIIFDTVIAIVIGLLILAGPTAANALFSLYTSSNSIAWLSPIIWRAWYGRTAEFKPGPFYLGEFWSRVNNIIASLYLIFSALIISVWPTVSPVNADTMNYTCVINPAVWIGCLIYYWVDGHKWFQGPKLTIDVEVLESKEGPIDNAIVRMPNKHGEDSSQQRSSSEGAKEPIITQRAV